MKKTLLDIEVFYEHFEVSIEDYVTCEKTSYFVNQIRDDRLLIRDYLRNYKGFMITFNGLRYDFAVLTYIDQNNWFLDLSWEDFCEKAKIFSDTLIKTKDDLFVYQYMNKSFKQIIQIDLYLFWARLLRISKKVSLKGLGIQLKYPVIQELPYDPDIRNLTVEQINEINHYCSIHDLGVLRLLTDQLEGTKTTVPLGDLGTIQLRNIIQKEYGISAWSMDAPKIASTALLNHYCRVTGLDPKVVSKWRFERPVFKFGDLFKDIDFDFKTPLFKSIYDEWMNSVNTFSKEFILIDKEEHGCKISCGIGGLHSILSNKIFKSEDDYILLDIDIELKMAQLKLC